MTQVTPSRDLDWPDCLNARDFGGLRTSDGGTTRWGAVVRSDHPSYLTDAGWQAMWDHGIRTVISLETEGRDPQIAAHNNCRLVPDQRFEGLTHLRFRIEDGNDAEFMTRWAETGLWVTPLYYADALSRWPRRIAALVRHVARAQPGGVLLHCRRGCDRTGLATAVLLALAGVAAQDIAADYARSAERLAAREPGCGQRLQSFLAAHDTTVEQVFAGLPRTPALERHLLAAGLSREDLTAARRRLAPEPA
jgi:protein-tyrosine phosphatase